MVLLLLSESVLEDSIAALGFPVCFYYGFTGIACAIYYRRELTKSPRNFLLLGVGPLLGGLMLWGVGVKAAIYYGHSDNVSSKPILGITLLIWMGIGGMVLGFIAMLVRRPFFTRVLLAQDRSRSGGPARAAAADGAGARARRVLSGRRRR